MSYNEEYLQKFRDLKKRHPAFAKREPNMKQPRVVVTSHVSLEQHQALQQLSERMDRSVAWLVRDAIAEYMKINAEQKP